MKKIFCKQECLNFILRSVCITLGLLNIPTSGYTSLNLKKRFATTLTKFITNDDHTISSNTIMWEQNAPYPFNELIFSWNALRPFQGTITFWVSILHKQWAPWHRIAVWGTTHQQTFINKLNPFVHTKHVRVEMQRKHIGRAFKIKAVFSNGAPKESLKAFFACLCNSKHYRRQRIFNQPSWVIKGVPLQSQMELNHPRSTDLCSPTSLSMIIRYFADKLYGAVHYHDLHDYAIDFAEKVLDNGYLDIYGNWVLNIAEAYNASQGDVYYRVERLNSFNDLYQHIRNNIPIAVSVRKLKGGATPYANGHFLVVIGWNNKTKSVICIDPAFASTKSTIKTYKLRNFLRAWALSRNLSYVPLVRQPL